MTASAVTEGNVATSLVSNSCTSLTAMPNVPSWMTARSTPMS